MGGEKGHLSLGLLVSVLSVVLQEQIMSWWAVIDQPYFCMELLAWEDDG